MVLVVSGGPVLVLADWLVLGLGLGFCCCWQ